MNRDGIIDRDELVKGYKEFLNVDEEQVDKILEVADADGNGEIEYSEWIIATINKKELLSDEKLMTAFTLFDQDGGGSISAEEICEVLGVGKNIDDDVWNDIIGEVDQEGDGEITFEVF
jgi:calcium-dependent protein kinase